MDSNRSITEPMRELMENSDKWKYALEDVEFARAMDKDDPLRGFREQFCYPKLNGLPKTVIAEEYRDCEDECIYLCGHSLGLMPRATRQRLLQQLDDWAALGVYGYFHGELPWSSCDEYAIQQSARLVGASPQEVGVMKALTVNQHLLMISFYRPTPTRHKILIEDHAFPSDHYCAESQIRQRGYDPATSLIFIKPRAGEDLLQTEDVLELLEREGDSIAVVLLPGVQYYTGQVLDMKTIAKAGHDKGCYVGFDLAHAVGNIELQMHDWDVDFACWCNYKYLNASAGAIAGMYVHERFAGNQFPMLLGWSGHRMETRFRMDNVMELSRGVAGYRISIASGLQVAALMASLGVFSQTSMSALRHKSKLQTAYLEHLLLTHLGQQQQQQQQQETGSTTSSASSRPFLRIITPSDPDQRGNQMSIWLSVNIHLVFIELTRRGVVLDKREPSVLRVSVCPLYNTFEDCHRFVSVLTDAMHAAAATATS